MDIGVGILKMERVKTRAGVDNGIRTLADMK